jgi:hypothetical protein
MEGEAQADRGEFVPDDVVAEADMRHGLQYFPERHPLVPESAIRSLWLGRYPYVI